MLSDYPEILEILAQVPDPEIPVISILDLGIIRDIEMQKDLLVITITPTYSGCPAMNIFEMDIIASLGENNYNNVKLKTVYDPAWTTDWISEEARAKLKKYGIAPPQGSSQDKSALFQSPSKIECPLCDSTNTNLVSQFGSTACKAMYTCKDCLEPFEYFKCL